MYTWGALQREWGSTHRLEAGSGRGQQLTVSWLPCWRGGIRGSSRSIGDGAGERLHPPSSLSQNGDAFDQHSYRERGRGTGRERGRSEKAGYMCMREIHRKRSERKNWRFVYRTGERSDMVLFVYRTGERSDKVLFVYRTGERSDKYYLCIEQEKEVIRYYLYIEQEKEVIWYYLYIEQEKEVIRYHLYIEQEKEVIRYYLYIEQEKEVISTICV